MRFINQCPSCKKIFIGKSRTKWSGASCPECGKPLFEVYPVGADLDAGKVQAAITHRG